MKRNNVKYVLFISFALSIMTGVIHAEKIVFHSIESDYYATDTENILATYSGGKVMERDLFLYLHLTRDEAPDLYAKYMEAEDPDERDTLKETIKNHIQDIVYKRMLQSQNASVRSPIDSSLLEKRIRIMLYPIYDYMWVKYYIENQVKILEEDIKLYYQHHKNDFVHPEMARVRIIFLKAPEDLPMPDRLKIRQKLEQIRDDIIAGADFADMAQKYSEAKNATQGGILPPFARGVFYHDFESAAFALEPDQISPLHDGKDGFYILQLLAKIPPRDSTLGEARPIIIERLRRQQRILRHEYEFNKLVSEAMPKIDLANFEVRSDDTAVVKVRKFVITKQDMLELFPGIYKELIFDSSYLIKQATYISTFEVIAQQVERARLISTDGMLESAVTMAKTLVEADIAEKDYFKKYVKITEDDEKKYFEEHKDEIKEASLYYVYQIWGELRNPAQVDPETRRKLEQQLRRKVDDFLAEMKVNLATLKLELLAAVLEGQESQPKNSQAVPSVDTIRAALRKLEDSNFTFNIKDAGYINLNHIPLLKQYIDGLAPAEFSIPYEEENSVVWFYVDNVIEGEKLTFEKGRTTVFFILLKQKREEVLSSIKDSLMKTAAISYLF